MKLKGNNIFDNQISKLSVFRKGGSGKEGTPAGNNEPRAEVASICCSPGLGWDHPELQTKRLIAFVKGIQVSGWGVSGGNTNSTNEFTINVDTFDYENLTFQLHRMSPKGLTTVGMNHEMAELENHVKISYGVDEPGRYLLEIKYLGIPVPNSPFKINVQQQQVEGGGNCAKDVFAFGKGLKRCMAGQIATFQLDVKKTNYRGQISVVADGDMDVPLRIEELKSGYKVHYLATSTGVFFLRVKIDGKHISGSPFMVKAEGGRREIPETMKYLFSSGFLAGSKEIRNDLQP